MLLKLLLVCFFAGLGAGLGTGFAGMSAAAVISPMLITFLHMDAYQAVGIALASDVLASAVSAYTYGKNKNLDIRNGAGSGGGRGRCRRLERGGEDQLQRDPWLKGARGVSNAIIVAIVSGLFTLLGSFAGVLASHNLTAYRLCRHYDRNTLTLPRRLYGNTNRRFVLLPCYSFSAA